MTVKEFCKIFETLPKFGNTNSVCYENSLITMHDYSNLTIAHITFTIEIDIHYASLYFTIDELNDIPNDSKFDHDIKLIFKELYNDVKRTNKINEFLDDVMK